MSGGLTALVLPAVAVPVAVYLWQVVGAARTFAHRPQDLSPLSSLITLGFVALVFGAWTVEPNRVLVAAGCAGLAVALVLFEWARRTVRGQYFSYIFAKDTPTFLCTSGPYARIRNPFYTSYLVTMVSTAVMFPSLFRAGVVVAMVAYFTAAAAHEEKKFARSTMAEAYTSVTRRGPGASCRNCARASCRSICARVHSVITVRNR